jgi:hypothetical protein
MLDRPGDHQSELTVAASGNTVVAGFNDCTGVLVSPSPRHGTTGWGFSIDGGQTWSDPGSDGALPFFAPGTFGTNGDPSLDVDSAGYFYFSNLYTQDAMWSPYATNSVSVHKGHYYPNLNKFVWNTPTLAFVAPNLSQGADKPMIAVDPRTNGDTAVIYVAYTNFNATPAQIEVSRSTDGANTWGNIPVIIATGQVLGAIPRVGPNGEIYVAWEDNVGQLTGRHIKIRKALILAGLCS